MRKAALLLMGLLILTLPSFAQVERHKTVDGTGVSLGTGRGIEDAHSRTVQNQVTLTGRHCQKYVLHSLSLESAGRIKVSIRTGEKGTDWIDYGACVEDPSTKFFDETHTNLRTNAGGDWQASVMANTSAPPATCNYIGLSNNSVAPSTSDTSLASEITTNGLARAQGTYAHTNGTSSFTVQKVFSATGTQASQEAGLFNAAGPPVAGTLCFENTYTQVTVNNGDTLTVTWTVNY